MLELNCAQIISLDEIDEILHLDPAWRLRHAVTAQWAQCKGSCSISHCTSTAAKDCKHTVHQLDHVLIGVGHLALLLSYALDHFRKHTSEDAAQTDDASLFLSANLGTVVNNSIFWFSSKESHPMVI